MPEDDALFEKALARQMRNRTPSDDAAANGGSAPGEAGAQQRNLGADACPDAEILAAYHERLLASDEMNLWKEHIFSCTRCQEILSQLEATEDVEVGTHEEDFAMAGHLRELAPVARALPATVAAQVAALMVPRRRSSRYWIAPAGAIAAGLLVWLGMHQQSKNVLNQPESQIAENRPVAAPSGAAQPNGAMSRDEKAATPSEIDGKVSPAASAPLSPEKKKLAAKLQSPVAPNAPAISASASRRASADKSVGGLDAGAEQMPKAMTETVEVVSEAGPVAQQQSSGANTVPLPTVQQPQTTQMAATPPPPAPPQKYSQDQVTQGQNAQVQNAQVSNAQAQNAQGQNNQVQNNQAQNDKDALSANARSATGLTTFQAGTGVGAAKGAVGFRDVAAVQNIHMIPAPGGKVIWRVGIAGLIEESANAGATWTRQNSGVLVTLDSGTAPSEAVCWVFGHAGTILRTIDGGAHWTKIVSPIAGDVGGVLAADALRATVWDVGKKNNFVTADGGATWTRVVNP
jgi:hypothetical protein